jgi:hypothetical protein
MFLVNILQIVRASGRCMLAGAILSCCVILNIYAQEDPSPTDPVTTEPTDPLPPLPVLTTRS